MKTYIANQIAILLNEVAKTGKYPEELKLGILAPQPKPNKRQKIGGVVRSLKTTRLVLLIGNDKKGFT